MAIATPLSTSGRFIVDANGKRIRLAGVNWYGASEDMGVPAGLDRIDRGTLAGLIAAQGFNSVRLPFSVWMTEQTAPVPQQFLTANPDLDGKTPLEVYDACVKALTDHGLIVIPNCHLLDFGWCCTQRRQQRPVVQRPLPGPEVHRRLADDRQAVRVQSAGRRDGHQERAPAGEGRRARDQADLGNRGPDRFRRHVHLGREHDPPVRPACADHLRGAELRSAT